MERNSGLEANAQQAPEDVEEVRAIDQAVGETEAPSESTIVRLIQGARHLISQADESIARGIKNGSFDI